MEDVYKRLAVKLDELPNGYPATESGVELSILKKVFAPEEAEMALKLKPIPETADAVAARLDRPLAEIQAALDVMAEKGQIGSAKMFGNQVYMLVPFVVGIFEFQLNRMDKEFADLVEEYAPSLIPALGGFAPAVTRVIPINAPIDAQHQVFRYEDVRKMFEKAKSFQLMECICRKEQSLQGHNCTHTLETCLAFSNHEGAFDKYARGKHISKEEALKVVELSEAEGLVHTSYNVQAGHMFLCNCCSCCCGILRGMKQFNAPYLMAKSNFVAVINPDECAACGVCADERCPMGAIQEQDGSYTVQPERCIGCGVCTTTCPTESISLVRKPASQVDEPPANLLEWYGKRADSRGIKIIV